MSTNKANAVVVKTKFVDDIRRFSCSGDFDELLAMVASFYPGQRLLIKYVDDEGDEVRITGAPEFSEAVRMARALVPPVLRLTLVPSNDSPKLTATTSPRMAAPTAEAVQRLDQIQEKIVATLGHIQTLAQQKSPQEEAPLEAPQQQQQQNTSVAANCSQLSREIAQQCAEISKELPQYTSRISEEIAEQCRKLSEEMSARCRLVSAQVSSEEAYKRTVGPTAASCNALHKEMSERCSSAVQETVGRTKEVGAPAPAQLEELEKLSSQIESKCRGLAEETTKMCADISRDIVSLVKHI